MLSCGIQMHPFPLQKDQRMLNILKLSVIQYNLIWKRCLIMPYVYVVYTISKDLNGHIMFMFMFR